MTDTKTEAEDAFLAAAAGEAAEAAEVADAALAAEAEAEEAKRVYAEAQRQAFDLLFVQGLYASVDRTTPVGEAIEAQIRYHAFAFDAYCVQA